MHLGWAVQLADLSLVNQSTIQLAGVAENFLVETCGCVDARALSGFWTLDLQKGCRREWIFRKGSLSSGCPEFSGICGDDSSRAFVLKRNRAFLYEHEDIISLGHSCEELVGPSCLVLRVNGVERAVDAALPNRDDFLTGIILR